MPVVMFSDVVVAVVVLAVVVAAFVPVAVQSAPEIRLPVGVIRGSDKAAVTTNKPYRVYYGIPFALPPLGGLRFKSPQPFVTTNPNQVISSETYKPACIQFRPLEQSEDCLYLNIYSPNGTTGLLNDRSLKKVMVWIHGGGYIAGTSRYYLPTRMVTDYDVIVVTVQYRLGPLGFLSTGDATLPGNNGLRDQLMALNWVKANIRQFGGDADDITLFGESAGAVSISFLAISPLAKGLFTKAILLSGTALAPWAYIKNGEELFYKLAVQTGCQPIFYFPGIIAYYYGRIIECMREVPAAKLTSLNSLFVTPKTARFDVMQYVSFAPVVDGDLLPRDPHSLLADRDYLEATGTLDRKYVMGANNNEGIVTVEFLMEVFGGDIPPDFYTDKLFADSYKTATQDFLGLTLTSDVINYVDLMYKFPLGSDGKATFRGNLELIGDTAFILPAIQFANALTMISPDTDVYLYLLDYYPELKEEDSVVQGSTHGLGLSYLFDENLALSDNLHYYARVYTDSALPVMQHFRSLFTNFAISGTPIGNGNVAWPRYDPRKQNFLAISEEAEVRQQMYAHRVSLWTEFFPRLIRVLLKVGPRGRSYVI